ncbi:ATP-binding protein [Listeria floridensis]|uniref:ATP-binding protein n=1 Tax=Listeria floridensis TaxID=1494962 RepID=UPI0004B7737F|nr:ATP-binding protein [Listeria floridensis]
MDEFSRRVQKYIVKYDLIRPNEKLLVAVSGGPDSLALLHFLLQFHKGNISVAHVNHSLRTESEAEKQLVAEFAANYKLPFF